MYSIYWRAESTSETNSKQEPGDNTRTCRDKSAGYNSAELHKYRTSIRVLSYSGDSVSKKKTSIFFWFIDVAHVAFSVVSPGEPGSNFDGDCSFNFLGRG